MNPVDPSKAAKPKACTLMTTLPEGADDATVARILEAIPPLSAHDRLKAVGILILKYKAPEVHFNGSNLLVDPTLPKTNRIVVRKRGESTSSK